MTGFIKQQEIRLALKLLKWRYENAKLPMPDENALQQQAERLVEEANRIAKERGKNVIGIVKDLIDDIRK
jgi:hypothetical protein